MGFRPAFPRVPNPRALLPQGGPHFPWPFGGVPSTDPSPLWRPPLLCRRPNRPPPHEPSRSGPRPPTPRRCPLPATAGWNSGAADSRAGGRRTAPGPARPAPHSPTGSRKPRSPAASTAQNYPASLRPAAAAARAFCCRVFSGQPAKPVPDAPPPGRALRRAPDPAPDGPRPRQAPPPEAPPHGARGRPAPGRLWAWLQSQFTRTLRARNQRNFSQVCQVNVRKTPVVSRNCQFRLFLLK